MSGPRAPNREGPTARGALLLAALTLAVVERVVPYGRLALYPLVLFATWVHEMGHGLAALASGGRFTRLDMYPDASGMAHIAVSPGHPAALSAAAGLLAPPVLAGVILAFARGPRRARVTLAVLSAALGASLILWIRGPVGMLVAAGVAAALASTARWASERAAVVCAQLLALLLGVDAVRRADYLFTASAQIGGRPHPSDVSAIAGVWGGSHLVWGGVIAAVGALAFALGLWLAWRAPRRAPAVVRGRAGSGTVRG